MHIVSLKRLSRDERLLVVGQAVSTVGDYMALPAFLKIGLERGDEVPGLFLVLYFLPRVMQPLFGLLIDRFNARSVLLLAESARGLLFFALFLYPADASTRGWLALGFGGAICSCVFEPARLKLMSGIATDFAKLNSIFYFYYSVTGILSIGLSILVEGYAATNAVFLINAITFGASLVTLLFISYAQPSVDERPRLSAGAVGDAFRFLFKQKIVLLATTAVVITDFFTGALYELFPERSISIGIQEYGTYIFVLLVCVGNTLGAIGISALYKRRRVWVSVTLGSVASAIAFALVDSLWTSLAMALIFFTAQILLIGVSEVAIEEIAPSEIQGRLFGINEAAPILALSLGSLVSSELGATALLTVAVGSTCVYALLARSAFVTRGRHRVSDRIGGRGRQTLGRPVLQPSRADSHIVLRPGSAIEFDPTQQ